MVADYIISACGGCIFEVGMVDMKIKCTEEQKKRILKALEDICPFAPDFKSGCCEDSDCYNCMEGNIEFEVVGEVKI